MGALWGAHFEVRLRFGDVFKCFFLIFFVRYLSLVEISTEVFFSPRVLVVFELGSLFSTWRGFGTDVWFLPKPLSRLISQPGDSHFGLLG